MKKPRNRPVPARRSPVARSMGVLWRRKVEPTRKPYSRAAEKQRQHQERV